MQSNNKTGIKIAIGAGVVAVLSALGYWYFTRDTTNEAKEQTNEQLTNTTGITYSSNNNYRQH